MGGRGGLFPPVLIRDIGEPGFERVNPTAAQPKISSRRLPQAPGSALMAAQTMVPAATLPGGLRFPMERATATSGHR